MKSLVDLLADAFQNDPLNTYVVPDPVKRRQKATWFYTQMVHFVEKRGRIDQIPGQGAALWLEPGKSNFTWRDLLTMGALQWPFRLGIGTMARLIRANTGLGPMPTETHAANYWYLFMLAVDEAARGQGVVRKLLQPVLDESDRTGIPIRLETNSARNVPIYEHFGFHVVNYSDQLEGLAQWNLIRTPQNRQLVTEN